MLSGENGKQNLFGEPIGAAQGTDIHKFASVWVGDSALRKEKPVSVQRKQVHKPVACRIVFYPEKLRIRFQKHSAVFEAENPVLRFRSGSGAQYPEAWQLS